LPRQQQRKETLWAATSQRENAEPARAVVFSSARNVVVLAIDNNHKIVIILSFVPSKPLLTSFELIKYFKPHQPRPFFRPLAGKFIFSSNFLKTTLVLRHINFLYK
jgi:hypothetical protein